MDLARRLGRLGALDYRPGADLLGAGGEVADQAEQGVACAHEVVEARFLDAEVGKEERLLLVVELGDLRLDAGADRDDGGLFRRRDPAKLFYVFVVVVADIVFADVGDVEHRLEGEQAHVLEDGELVVGEVEAAGGLALLHLAVHPLEERKLRGKRFVALHVAAHLVHAAAEHLKVGEDQLHVDDLHVARGIDRAVDVDDVGVVEAAHDVRYRVHLANVGKELVAQSLALGGALDQTRDVDELDHGGGVLFGMVHLSQHVEAPVRHRHHAHVGLDGAEGVVRRLRAGVGNGVEKGALAHVGQSHDSEFHSILISLDLLFYLSVSDISISSSYTAPVSAKPRLR